MATDVSGKVPVASVKNVPSTCLPNVIVNCSNAAKPFALRSTSVPDGAERGSG
jgi:hypothetical protein